MAYIRVNQRKVTPKIAEKLISLCPFGAISSDEGNLRIDDGCRMCRQCLKEDQDGVLSIIEDKLVLETDKSGWSGIAVFAECIGPNVHPVTLELLGKAHEMAAPYKIPVFAVLVGWNKGEAVLEPCSSSVAIFS